MTLLKRLPAQASQLYIYRLLEIVRVVDGDTIDAIIDLGFGISITERIRLANVDAFEVRGEERAKGLAAFGFVVATLLTGSIASPRHNDILRLVSTKFDYRGSFGRILGRIEYRVTEDEHWLDLGDVLIAEGHGTLSARYEETDPFRLAQQNSP